MKNGKKVPITYNIFEVVLSSDYPYKNYLETASTNSLRCILERLYNSPKPSQSQDVLRHFRKPGHIFIYIYVVDESKRDPL